MTTHQRPGALARVTTTAALVALTFGATSALTGGAAMAQDAKPVPDCHGIAFEDPKGDATDVDRFDITGGFFNFSGDVATANIRVADYSDGNATGAVSAQWTMQWTADDVTHFVAAESSGGPPTFNYGTYDGSVGYSTVGETTGKTYPGPDGIISIVIPAGSGGADGALLKAPEAHTQSYLGVPGGLFGLLSSIDDAPDSGGGTDYPVSACEAAGDALTVKTTSLKRSKAKKGRTVSFSLQGNATGLKGTLKKGRTTYGSGKLASLNGAGKLKMKLKRSLKKGTYTLSLSGTSSDGQRAKVSQKIKVK